MRKEEGKAWPKPSVLKETFDLSKMTSSRLSPGKDALVRGLLVYLLGGVFHVKVCGLFLPFLRPEVVMLILGSPLGRCCFSRRLICARWHPIICTVFLSGPGVV